MGDCLMSYSLIDKNIDRYIWLQLKVAKKEHSFLARELNLKPLGLVPKITECRTMLRVE